jgi:hypothetical protein
VELLHVLALEERFAAVQPRHRILLAIECREFEADAQVETVVVVVVILATMKVAGFLQRRPHAFQWKVGLRRIADGVDRGVDVFRRCTLAWDFSVRIMARLRARTCSTFSNIWNMSD